MKHKNFNEILPYTYFIQHKETGKKYYGVRTANVVLGLTPNQDFSSANMYKRTEDLKSGISRKRNEKYNIKLANMSDEDFEVFIEGKNSLWAELTRKRRIKAILNQQAGSNETC